MEHLPIYMNLRQRRCIVVGGGPIAARKAALLLAAGAHVCMVAPQRSEAAAALIAAHPETLQWNEACFEPGHLDGCTLVIAATDRREVNQAVAAAADTRGIPANVADQPDLCRFILPAIVERGPLTIAIGSGGRAPVLVRRLRARLESLIPVGYGWLAELAGRMREPVGRVLPDVARRRSFWERAFDGPAGQLALNGALGAAEARLHAELEVARSSIEESALPPGEVYLIGAGPGDPDLLTFKALRLLQQADVIVHDRLVAREVVDLGRREADRICVGKQRSQHALSQDGINALLVDLARSGKKVARLKGGDPFVFGRGGEELEALVAAGIPAQVVPGVTAASGCAAYAGIPLTHRDHADRVRILTGQTRDGRFVLQGLDSSERADAGLRDAAAETVANADGTNIDDAKAAPSAQPKMSRETLVIYMGLGALPDIAQQLVANGRDHATPVAVVSHGTTARQRVIRATLDDIAGQVAKAGIESPALIIVGAVAALADRLAWFHPDADANGDVGCHFPLALPTTPAIAAAKRPIAAALAVPA